MNVEDLISLGYHPSFETSGCEFGQLESLCNRGQIGGDDDVVVFIELDARATFDPPDASHQQRVDEHAVLRIFDDECCKFHRWTPRIEQRVERLEQLSRSIYEMPGTAPADRHDHGRDDVNSFSNFVEPFVSELLRKHLARRPSNRKTVDGIVRTGMSLKSRARRRLDGRQIRIQARYDRFRCMHRRTSGNMPKI
jgi:hypothetical protein